MTAARTEDRARDIAAAVPDPELPQLTLADLGILRDVSVQDETVVVTITPTYSGCPALTEMRHDLVYRLHAAGYADVDVRITLQPAWSSDWITGAGRAKLAAAGIAPPARAPRRRAGPIPLTLTPAVATVACPQCGSTRTTQRSAFGPTACRALYACAACGEPFEYLKEI